MHLNVLDYLEETANRIPDKTAIIDKDGSCTFAELWRDANRIGTYLHRKFGSVNRPVFVSVDRSMKPIIAYMGVIASGNFYVPIDTKTPPDRLEAMMEALQPVAFIHFGMKRTIAKLPQEAGENVPLIDYETVVATEADSEALRQVRFNILDIDPCYVLFTSGSTGVPKGVVISHRMVVDLTEWLNSVTEITEADNIGNQTPFFFDASVKDIYQMLKTGATLCIMPTQLFMFPVRVLEYLNDHKITVILWAASAIAIVASSGILELQQPEHLRLMTFAGEQLSTKHMNLWKEAAPGLGLINLYGPTETTVDCAYYVVDREYTDDEIIPIGKACRNKQLFMLDEDGNVIEDGIGELCVRGSGVSMGYYNDPERTAQVFVQNPMQHSYREMIYKTGDLVRKDEHGNYIFVSRKDNQIKRQGHRIELGEIESAMHALENVDSCMVLYNPENEDLIGVYTGDEEDEMAMAKGLLETLPKYMLPTHFVHLAKMPYTANGKIDRKQLMQDIVA